MSRLQREPASTTAPVTYVATENEQRLFRHAFEQRLPLMLTGPTGCGKTRLVEHMGDQLSRPVITISCHDDLTSSDLVGRFLVAGFSGQSRPKTGQNRPGWSVYSPIQKKQKI